MGTWKVSYVIKGSSQAGGIINLDHPLEVGDTLTVGNDEFEILEAKELIPSRGEFHYIHVTCVPVDSAR